MFLVDETRDAHNQHQALRDLVARLQPADVPLREAPTLYRELAGMARLVGGAMTLLADRVAESEVWKREGFPSPAEWFARVNGTSAQPARAALATSRRLGALSETEAAVRRGALSGVQADLIADAATRDAESESDLVSLAGKVSVMELRQECLRRKAASDRDPNKTAERLHAERHVRTHTDTEGAWNLHARGPVVSGSRIGQAVNLITDKLFRHARTEGHTDTPRDAHAYDALQAMADCFWDVYHGHQPTWTWNANTPPADSSDGLVQADADPASVSGEHGGNDTGGAGAVSRQDVWSSQPGNDISSPRGERTDTTSSRGGSDLTRVGVDGSDDLMSRSDGRSVRADRDADDTPTSQAGSDVTRAGSSNEDDSTSQAGSDVTRAGSSSDGDRASRAGSGVTRAGCSSDHDVGGVGVDRADRRRGVSSVKRPALRDLTVVHVDLAALVRGHLLEGERCEMPGLGPVTVDDVRGLLPTAILKLVVTDGARPVNVTHLGSGLGWTELGPGAQRPPRRPAPSAPRHLVLARLDTAMLRGDPPLIRSGDALAVARVDAMVLPGDMPLAGSGEVPGVGRVDRGAVGGLVASWVLDRMTAGVDVDGQVHHGRGLNTAQWAASLWAQPLCSVQGCNRLRVEYDHRHPWADTHRTALGNIDPLCGHHHRLKTHEGWALVDGTGPRPMVPPAHPQHPHNRRAPAPASAAGGVADRRGQRAGAAA